MNKKRALAASRDPYNIYTIRDPGANPPSIVLQTGTEEHLKITKTGFYVRGKLVEQDDKEAEIVYNAFREWMVYSALTRNY
jgi:hypothetical protein